MIRINGKEITGVHWRGKAITAIYVGARLVWQAISSVWRSRDVWRSNDVW